MIHIVNKIKNVKKKKKLSQFLAAPMKGHWIALKHVLRYLKGTLDFELCYRKCDDSLTLIGYSDADWASSTDDRRSISGYCFSLNRTVLLFLGNQRNNNGGSIIM